MIDHDDISFNLGVNTSTAWMMAAATNLRASKLLAKEALRAREASRYSIDFKPNTASGRSVFNEYDRLEEMSKPSLMLLGLAIECMLKGIKSANIFQPNLFHSKPNTELFNYSHNLKNLAEKMEIKLTKEELNILEGLGRYIEWKGRYMVPKKVQKFKDDKRKTISKNPYFYIESNGKEVFSDPVIKLLNKLIDILNQSIKKEFHIRKGRPT